MLTHNAFCRFHTFPILTIAAVLRIRQNAFIYADAVNNNRFWQSHTYVRIYVQIAWLQIQCHVSTMTKYLGIEQRRITYSHRSTLC